MNNALRIGNFTSSEIVALLSMGVREMTPEELAARPKKGKGSSTLYVPDMNSLGDAALTYIEECNMERRLGRSLTNESDNRPCSWGQLLEKRVHDILGTSYEYCSDKTLLHPRYNCWAGTKDFKYHAELSGDDAVCDSKCPMTLKSFCTLVDAWEKGGIKQVRKDHKEGEKYYWQLVSNACIEGVDYAELILYVPAKNELDYIRSLAMLEDGYHWVARASDDELPWILPGGHYKNLYIMRFPVPVDDKRLLEHRVRIASEKLIGIGLGIIAR